MNIKETLSPQVQKKERPPINKICELLITDPTLDKFLKNFLSFLAENKIKPSWYHTNHYQCTYKGEKIISIKLGCGFNNINNKIEISIRTTCLENLALYDQLITDKMRKMFVSNFDKCNCCGHADRKPCESMVTFEYNNAKHENICIGAYNGSFTPTFRLDCSSNLDEQFEHIKDFCIAKIKFIDLYRDKLGIMKGSVRGGRAVVGPATIW